MNVARLRVSDDVETIGRWVTYHLDGSIKDIVPSKTKGRIIRIVAGTATISTAYGDLNFYLKFIRKYQLTDIDSAINEASKRLPLLSVRQRNKSLEFAAGSMAEAYQIGAEEAQEAIIDRLQMLKQKGGE